MAKLSDEFSSAEQRELRYQCKAQLQNGIATIEAF